MSAPQQIRVMAKSSRNSIVRPIGTAQLFATGLHQHLLAAFSRLRVQPTNLLPAGMEIASYNHHAKAPSFPEALVLNRRLPVSDRAFALIQSTSHDFREVGNSQRDGL